MEIFFLLLTETYCKFDVVVMASKDNSEGNQFNVTCIIVSHHIGRKKNESMSITMFFGINLALGHSIGNFPGENGIPEDSFSNHMH